jgi:uncharacterized glyoxalase superfamily protein PhnB
MPSKKPKTRRTAARSTRPARARAASRTAPKAPIVAASGLAPGMQGINTYLAVANVRASVEFLERAFGFTRGVVLPAADGQLRYAEMRHRDSVVMLVPRGDAATATGGAAGLYTYVDDVDAAIREARDAGAAVGDADDKAWGDRAAIATDPDGYRWVLATFKKLTPFQVEGDRRKGTDRRTGRDRRR